MEKSYIINQTQYDEFKKLYDEITKLPEETQRLIYYSNAFDDKYQVFGHFVIHGIKESDDKITVYEQVRERFCGKKIFYKTTSFSCFCFYRKSKKIKFFGTDIKKSSFLIEEYFNFCKYDWFNNMSRCLKELITKTVLEHIIAGKITSEEQYIKKTNKVSFNGVFYWRSIKNFIKWYNETQSFYGYGLISLLRQIAKTVDNPNAFIERIIKGEVDKNYLNIFRDLYSQCIIFDKKICWKWSLNRLNDFHLKLTLQQAELKGELREDNKIEYIGNLPMPTEAKCSLISDEKAAYIEGEEQSNCVYTTYWKRIKEKSYFVLSCRYPERASVGITVSKSSPNAEYFDTAYLSQIYTRFNKNVRPETKEIFKKWLNNPDVQSFFINNFYLNVPKEKKEKVCVGIGNNLNNYITEDDDFWD